MVMDKKLNRELMEYAEECLQDKKCPLYKKEGVINESYNGQVSALGVSVLMIGLKATLAVYYQDANRRHLLDVIVKMINKKKGTTYSNAYDFVHKVVQNDEDELKSLVVNCSVALKQVIRTYKLG
jgi:hypothetical protein